MEQTTFVIDLHGLPETRLTVAVRALQRQLTRAGISVQSPESPHAAGARGDISVLGQIGLAVVSGGSLVAFIDCLKAFLSREKTLEINIKTSGGASVHLSSKNIGSLDLAKVLATQLRDSEER